MVFLRSSSSQSKFSIFGAKFIEVTAKVILWGRDIGMVYFRPSAWMALKFDLDEVWRQIYER